MSLVLIWKPRRWIERRAGHPCLKSFVCQVIPSTSPSRISLQRFQVRFHQSHSTAHHPPLCVMQGDKALRTIYATTNHVKEKGITRQAASGHCKSGEINSPPIHLHLQQYFPGLRHVPLVRVSSVRVVGVGEDTQTLFCNSWNWDGNSYIFSKSHSLLYALRG